jgi:hypothetical protein
MFSIKLSFHSAWGISFTIAFDASRTPPCIKKSAFYIVSTRLIWTDNGQFKMCDADWLGCFVSDRVLPSLGQRLLPLPFRSNEFTVTLRHP